MSIDQGFAELKRQANADADDTLARARLARAAARIGLADLSSLARFPISHCHGWTDLFRHMPLSCAEIIPSRSPSVLTESGASCGTIRGLQVSEDKKNLYALVQFKCPLCGLILAIHNNIEPKITSLPGSGGKGLWLRSIRMKGADRARDLYVRRVCGSLGGVPYEHPHGGLKLSDERAAQAIGIMVNLTPSLPDFIGFKRTPTKPWKRKPLPPAA